MLKSSAKLIETGLRLRFGVTHVRKSSSLFSCSESPSNSTLSKKMAESNEKSTRRLFCIANHCKGTSINPAKIPQTAFADLSNFPPLTPGVMRLYNMRYCPFAQRTRLVLEYKKIPYEMVNVNLKYKPDWFLERNPQGLVPVIEKDGHVIYESTATCEWLDDMFPENRLQPDDPDRKAWDRMLLEYFGQLTGILHRLFRRPEQREVILKKTKANFQYFEDNLVKRGGPYFGGSKVAMIDFYIWPHMERIPAMASVEPKLAITVSEFPKLAGWFQQMYSRPEVKATMMDNESHLHFLKSLAAGSPDYDHALSV